MISRLLRRRVSSRIKQGEGYFMREFCSALTPLERHRFYGFQYERSFFHINRIGVKSEPVFGGGHPALYGEVDRENDIFLPGQFIFIGQKLLYEHKPEVAGGVFAGNSVIP
jgi:hypothetical protein